MFYSWCVSVSQSNFESNSGGPVEENIITAMDKTNITENDAM